MMPCIEESANGVLETLCQIFNLQHNAVPRIELKVFSNNQPAINLYNKLGFVREGRKVEAVSVEGEYWVSTKRRNDSCRHTH